MNNKTASNTTNQCVSNDTTTAMRSVGGSLIPVARTIERSIEEGDLDRADLYLSVVAKVNERVDSMNEAELRALFDGLFAHIIDIRRGSNRHQSDRSH
jgi:hypothetical protein